MSRSPFKSIWFSPSQTIARIAHENPGYWLYTLPILAGFAIWPTSTLFPADDGVLENGLILSTLLTFGPVFEIVQLVVGAYLIRVTGVWLGGKAGVASIQTAIAWGNVPIVALAILGMLLMSFAALYSGTSEYPLLANESALLTGIGFFFLALQLAVVIWSVGIFWSGLAAVQGYSIGSAILNSLVAWTIPALLVVAGAVALGYSDKVVWLFFAGIDELVTFGER